MSPSRGNVQAATPRATFGTSDLVIACLMLVLGGGRVFQALWLREVWGAEATICLWVFGFGVLELVRMSRAERRSS